MWERPPRLAAGCGTGSCKGAVPSHQEGHEVQWIHRRARRWHSGTRGDADGTLQEALVQPVGAPLAPRSRNRCRADELVPNPVLGYTRAIEIETPPQLVAVGGADGSGPRWLYSFDGLENLVGCDIRSADRILPSPQQLGVGDLIRPGSARLPVLPRRPGHARRRWSSWGPTRARRTPPRRRTPRPNTRPGSGSLRPIPDTRERDWSPANACPIRLRRRHVTWSNRSDCHGTPDASRNQATRRARPPPKQGSSDRHACGDTRGLKREVCPCEWDGTKSH